MHRIQQRFGSKSWIINFLELCALGVKFKPHTARLKVQPFCLRILQLFTKVEAASNLLIPAESLGCLIASLENLKMDELVEESFQSRRSKNSRAPPSRRNCDTFYDYSQGSLIGRRHAAMRIGPVSHTDTEEKGGKA
ncbi:hypothetical protein V6N12_031801 [Hibiscus sabdariffa]|uniref:Uncharacterized protein n=1 Tax=Hibiscus sabdariffa TaxID=183260 RepID=A0ABR2A3Y4_9ROSI